MLGWAGVLIAFLPMILVSVLSYSQPGLFPTGITNLVLYSLFGLGVLLAIIGTIKGRE